MLVGFLASLAGARLVVGLILKYGLEKRLFALVPGHDPNPMHVHHFNYGLFLIGVAGWPRCARSAAAAARARACVRAGAGLVFDEFGLSTTSTPSTRRGRA